MAKQKQYTFISDIHRNNIERQAANANKQLESLRLFMELFGESISDAVAYQSKGADHKIKAVEAECIAWLESTNAPAYLYADSLQRARQSLGKDALEYYKSLATKINVNFDLSTVIDLSKDVAINKDGSWQLSDRFINSKLEAGRFTFTEDMIADYETFNSLRRNFLNFAQRGYYQLCKELVANMDDDPTAEYPLQDFAPMCVK